MLKLRLRTRGAPVNVNWPWRWRASLISGFFFEQALPMIAIAAGAVEGALRRRRDRVAGAWRDGVRRTLLASTMFGMAPLKTALMRRAGATWARAAGEWTAGPVLLWRSDPIWLRFQTIYWSALGDRRGRGLF